MGVGAQSSGMRLVADIGGTNVRFALPTVAWRDVGIALSVP